MCGHGPQPGFNASRHGSGLKAREERQRTRRFRGALLANRTRLWPSRRARTAVHRTIGRAIVSAIQSCPGEASSPTEVAPPSSSAHCPEAALASRNPLPTDLHRPIAACRNQAECCFRARTSSGTSTADSRCLPAKPCGHLLRVRSSACRHSQATEDQQDKNKMRSSLIYSYCNADQIGRSSRKRVKNERARAT